MRKGEALLLASKIGDLVECERLVNAGANIEAYDKKFGFTPLQWACYKGHVDVVRFLLNRGADMEVRSKIRSTPCRMASAGLRTGWTALHFASVGGSLEVVSLLLEHNADVEALTNLATTPARLAFLEKHLEIVKLLENHKAKKVNWCRRRDCVWLSSSLSGGNNLLYALPTDVAKMIGEFL